MGIVVSMLLIAGGAVMRYAVTVEGNGFDMHTTGVILMVVGAIGAVLSVISWSTWGGFGGDRTAAGGPSATRTTVTERDVR